MIVLAAVSVLTGSVLGLRFTVGILVPGIAFGLFAAVTAGFAHRDDLGTVALSMVLIAVGLQLGYVAGAGLHYLVEAARGRLRAISRPAH
jgi:hypothetical protein